LKIALQNNTQENHQMRTLSKTNKDWTDNYLRLKHFRKLEIKNFLESPTCDKKVLGDMEDYHNQITYLDLRSFRFVNLYDYTELDYDEGYPEGYDISSINANKKRFIEAIKNIKTSGFQEGENCSGPLINKSQFNKVMGFIKSGKEEKLKLEIGGDRMFEKGYFVQPTVFSGVPETSIVLEEVFGPIVFVMKPFKDFSEGLERVNKTKCSFSSGVFTKCPDTAEAFVRTVQTGTVWVNSYNMTNWNVPCGGLRMYGTGTVSGVEAVEEYSTTKSCYKKFDLSLCCPNKK